MGDGASANTPLPNASPEDSAGAPLSNASHEASGASAQTLVRDESKDGKTTDGQGADEALVTTSSRKGREGASAQRPGVDADEEEEEEEEDEEEEEEEETEERNPVNDEEEDEDKPLKKPVVTKKKKKRKKLRRGKNAMCANSNSKAQPKPF